MSTAQRLTNSSDETELSNLLSGDLVFSIPYFQRAYKWKPERLRQLEKDLLSIIDAEDTHFLGAIIMYARRGNPADPSVYEVIDGQQRTTTVFLYICAIVKTLCDNGLYDDAAGLFLKYLVIGIGREGRLASNSKLHSCKEDRAQLNRVFEHILSDTKFAEKLGSFRYKPLSATGHNNGRLWNNYRTAHRFLKDQVELEGEERLHGIYRALLGAVSVVQIVVRNPTDGPKIFDSLNSRQEPITTGDLVRNEIFSKVASEAPDRIEEIDQNDWQPFYSKFLRDEKSLFDSYFFPYGLIHDPNVKKSEVFDKLRLRWKDLSDPRSIINDLAKYQDAFLDVVNGTNQQGLPPDIAKALLRLSECDAPSSTYPFLMQLTNAVREGSIAPTVAVEVAAKVESFLIRRAVCGHEPTGLHAVFKRLWQDCDGSPTEDSVEACIRKHKTVVWPDDNDVRQAIAERPLYGASVTGFVLLEWNRHLGGDQPQGTMWIEHVLPDKLSETWKEHFSTQQHEALKGLLANLLPLSREMNQSLSNGPYEKKKNVYQDDSGFKAARSFARDYASWTPTLISERSQILADWAVKRWA
ncbi:DUF262 domain-containing protein [Stenotrophomonas sp. ATs4]|uniref:DUF262 domain-containing protein n=1 Tax=Stenotrophomonas sp. ATs4 TaxID=3402766 RepID=UPI003F709D36